MIHGLHSWFAPLQALALVASPRLELRQFWLVNINAENARMGFKNQLNIFFHFLDMKLASKARIFELNGYKQLTK